jgi:hypothetical protein
MNRWTMQNCAHEKHNACVLAIQHWLDRKVTTAGADVAMSVLRLAEPSPLLPR